MTTANPNALGKLNAPTGVGCIRLVRRMNRTRKQCVFEQFMHGAGTKRLSRKHSLPLLVVEQIIREHFV